MLFDMFNTGHEVEQCVQSVGMITSVWRGAAPSSNSDSYMLSPEGNLAATIQINEFEVSLCNFKITAF